MLAKSASRLPSPRTMVTWPACGQTCREGTALGQSYFESALSNVANATFHQLTKPSHFCRNFFIFGWYLQYTPEEEIVMSLSLRAIVALSTMCVTLAHAQDTSIRVGGSTTALPIISQCAAHFMEKYPSWDRADGSLGKDTTVVYVTGGGSGFGVKGLMNGTIDLGMVSRDLKDTEISALNQPTMKVFARDAVAIATSASNPLAKVKLKQGFTVSELASIFSGQYGQFSHIDKSLPAKPVVLLTRDASGGVTEIFQERVMKEQRLAPSRLQFPSTAGLVKKLESNNSAIAFVSAGAVNQERSLRVYSVDGVLPTQENIVNNSYVLNRPMQLIAKSDAPRKIQVFMDYVMGDCQQVVKDMGFVPVRTAAK